MAGFTGIVWDARTSDRLASDLGAGPGPAVFGEASAAWVSLAGALGEAAADYAAILSRLREHWESGHSVAALDRLAQLTGWLVDASGQAATAAALTAGQACALGVARLAMPNPAEIDVIGALAESASAAAAVAPMVNGAAALAERAAHDQRMRAVRVMESYETASEPLATPWHDGDGPPALTYDSTATSGPGRPPVPAVGGDDGSTSAVGAAISPIPMMPAMPRGDFMPPTVVQAAPATGSAQSSAPHRIVEATHASPAPPPPVSPMPAGAGDRTSVRPVVSESGADTPGASTSGAVESAAAPQTWADVAVSIETGARGGGAPALDPRYVRQTLSLDTEAG